MGLSIPNYEERRVQALERIADSLEELVKCQNNNQ